MSLSNTSGILSAAVGAAACAHSPSASSGPSVPPENSYRFYQCILDPVMPLRAVCKHIDESQKNDAIVGVPTQIIPIQKWVPSFADSTILKWKLFGQRSLEIQKS